MHSTFGFKAIANFVTANFPITKFVSTTGFSDQNAVANLVANIIYMSKYVFYNHILQSQKTIFTSSFVPSSHPNQIRKSYQLTFFYVDLGSLYMLCASVVHQVMLHFFFFFFLGFWIEIQFFYISRQQSKLGLFSWNALLSVDCSVL